MPPGGTLEGLSISPRPGNASGSPQEELEGVAGVRDVWVSLLDLLPP